MNDLPIWYNITSIFLFGLCFGSFLNVVALRGLSGEDMVFARSKCPKCKSQLKWYMNIPLLSYIFLRGKCAFCKTKISPQYPIVEFLTAASFVLMYLSFGLSIKTLFMCIFSFFFILLALTDILETVILDYHAYILTAFGLLYAVTGYSDVAIIQSIVGAISGFLIFEILSKIGEFFTKLRMFGEGDSLIALALGSIFGFKNLIIIIVLSLVIQTVFAIPVLIINSFKEKKTELAVTYILILISIISILAINCTDIINNYNTYTIITVIISLLMLYLLKNIIADIKSKKESVSTEENIDEILEKTTFSIMPFGPALIMAGFLGIFFIEFFKEIIIKFIY